MKNTLSYHNRTMNLQIQEYGSGQIAMAYQRGHRDASHAAAEIAAEADARIAELNEQVEAEQRNVRILNQQLTNCHDTMRKDGIRHGKLLLAVEDDQRRIAELEAELSNARTSHL